MDQFREEVVTRSDRRGESALFALAWVLLIFSGLSALIMINLLMVGIGAQGFTAEMIVYALMTLVLIAGAVLLFLHKDRIKTEYEYTFTNGILDFAKVFNNRKRQALGTMDVRNIEACGMVQSGSFHRYLSMPGIKRINWFLNRGADLFYLYYQKEGNKSLLVMEPSAEMREMIIRAAGPGKLQNN